MQKAIVWIAKFVATGAFLGCVPSILSSSKKYTGAGFIGTAIGWALLPLMPVSVWGQCAALLAALAAALATSQIAQMEYGIKDDPRIIIDETVGFWMSMAFLPKTLPISLFAFALFRFFDTVKLPPIKALERLPGGLGIVSDDVAAGIAANMLLRCGRHLITTVS